ncbi:MAG: IS66 family insertion sequence element accessory protein TnpB [Bacteroidota bacterium]|nr:IS66 family insertion sequence element accessory protein TnpB [Bacteroidota bacterium]
MIHISDKCRYLLYNGQADMRKSFHGLAAIVTYQMQQNVLNGDVYIFISKRRNAIKLLRFEGDGFALFYKRLEKGTFELPACNPPSGAVLISDNELIFILKGVALKQVKYRLRYPQNKAVCE